MSQSYDLPVGTDRLNVAIKTKIANSLEALRSLHSGTSAPSSTTANMLWLDTSTTPPVLKLRDTLDSAWISWVSVGASPSQRIAGESIASLSATSSVWLGPVPHACTAVRLFMFCETASTSTSGNEWQVQVQSYPHATPGSPVDLISATVGTFTTLTDVGGGEEFAANKALAFTFDQNQTLTDLDVLKLTITAVGSVTTLTNFHAYVDVI